jgi:hypothetical protein
MSDAVERIQRVRGVSDPKLEESPRVVEPGADILTLRPMAGGAPAPAGDRVTRLAIRETGRTYFIPVSSIDWIEGADYYVKLHVGGRVHLLREPQPRRVLEHERVVASRRHADLPDARQVHDRGAVHARETRRVQLPLDVA